MRLEELQKQFANQIYNPKNNKIFSEIKTSKIAIADRLEVYRNNVFGGFDSVLEIMYPATKQLVGADYFQNLCSKYHQQYPSTSGNLDEYGKYFSKLIGDLKNQHNLAYLRDLAALEWRYHLAYFIKDVEAFDLEKFQKLKQKDLFKVKFKLHPSCHLISSRYPIYSIWEFSNKKNNKKLNLENLNHQFILIERANWQVNIHNLSEPEFLFLKQLKNQKNIYQVYQDLGQKHQNIDIGSLINKYISNGVLSRFFLGF
jgi:hypothetical protein